MSFDKYHLMRDEEYQRLRQKQVQAYNPELRLLTRLDDDMNEILNDSSVPVDAKMRIFDHIKQRFKDVKSSTKAPTASIVEKTHVAQPLEVVPEEDEQLEHEDEQLEKEGDEGGDEDKYQMPPPPQKQKVMDDEVLKGVPANRQIKASNLLKMIQEHPDIISINNKNEIVLHGKTLRGSNYIDLFQSLYTHHVAQDSPAGNYGHTQFLKALNAINVPGGLISSNTQYNKLVELKKHTPTRPEDFSSGNDSPSKFADAQANPAPHSLKSVKTMGGKGLPPGKRQRMMTLYRI